MGTDRGIGEYTYIARNGSSTIDYLLTKESYFMNVVSFDVLPFNEWSDHCPLYFSLNVNVTPTPESIDNLSFDKHVYDVKLKDKYRSGIISQLTALNNLTNDIVISDRSCIDRLVTEFTCTIQGVADPLFCKHITLKCKSGFANTPIVRNKQWFDHECVHAKRLYVDALNCFNHCKTLENRENLCMFKSQYKKLIKKKRNAHKLVQSKKLENLRFSKPRAFWKHFRRNNNNARNDLSVEDFTKCFSELSNDIFQSKNDQAEQFVNDYDFDNMSSSDLLLDKHITVDDIVKAVGSLKTNKASGIDNLLNEYFLDSVDIIGSHLCDIFNAILDSGYFPECWTKGLIIPLHKKGSTNDVNNYRGITLVSCLSKIFTTVLNTRIVSYCEQSNVLSDAQFGFRKGRSTVDAQFVLLNLIQKFLNENKRLYCVFVDFKKAFDCVNRNALWLKMSNCGIRGKVLRIVKDMYENVKSSVKVLNTYSSFFEYAIGLRQGEVMSPILFSLFLEDLELFLQNDETSGLSIDDIVLILLLFADDMIILGDSPDDVNKSLQLLENYCDKWSLEVNTLKTKAMVFRKRGDVRPNEIFVYKGNVLDVVNDFNYLGTIFNYTGTFSLNQEHLVGKALKSLNVLMANCYKFDLKPNILCQLFDAFVGSVLSYGSEIWGFGKSKTIERVHLKFCKRLLNVRQTSCNNAIYGELGRFPLYVMRYVKIVNYWLKIVNSDHIIASKVYQMSLADCNRGKTNWIGCIKSYYVITGFHMYSKILLFIIPNGHLVYLKML